MGHQQALLYTLGLLVAGAAILVGIQKYNASQQEASREALTLDLLSIAAKAQAYYRMPRYLDGLEHSFAALTRQENALNYLGVASENENGQFQIVSGTENMLIIQAIGRDDFDGDGTRLTIEMKVYPDSVQKTIISY
jgi:hypothetical protein